MNTEDSNINYVYLLHAEGSDRFKIGHSNNPEGRCQKIRQQSPFPISLVCSYIVINAHECEQKLHKMFSHRRIHREWFVFESRDHARGLIDEFFSVGLHARLQNKEVKKSRKVDLKLAQDVCSLIKKSELPVITLYECFLHPSLIAYNLTLRMVEDVFDYLQELEIGKKYIEDDNAQTITFYLRKTPWIIPK